MPFRYTRTRSAAGLWVSKSLLNRVIVAFAMVASWSDPTVRVYNA
jgi:hypothetical protein